MIFTRAVKYNKELGPGRKRDHCTRFFSIIELLPHSLSPLTLNVQFALLMGKKEPLPFELKEISLLASPQLHSYSRHIRGVRKVRLMGMRDVPRTTQHQGQIVSDGAGGQSAGMGKGRMF